MSHDDVKESFIQSDLEAVEESSPSDLNAVQEIQSQGEIITSETFESQVCKKFHCGSTPLLYKLTYITHMKEWILQSKEIVLDYIMQCSNFQFVVWPETSKFLSGQATFLQFFYYFTLAILSKRHWASNFLRQILNNDY